MRNDIRNLTLRAYIDAKIKMLKKDFKIRLTASEMNYLQSLSTEISVDRYVRTLLYKKL